MNNTVNLTGNKNENLNLKGSLNIIGAQGYSAYEVWLHEGHEGTIEDFFRYLGTKLKAGEHVEITEDDVINVIGLLDKDDYITNEELHRIINSLDLYKLTYPDLLDLPKINGVELIGDKSSADLHISGGGEGNYLEKEVDPTVPNHVKNISQEDIERWNNGTGENTNCINDIPKVFIDGAIPTTKDEVDAKLKYISQKETFDAYVKIKCQGNSSMSYPKKNFTIKLYTNDSFQKKKKVDLNDWGSQSKFVLKANYIDHMHARNIISARLWSEIVKSRSDYNNLPELLRKSPNNGAIDGFPIKVYTNGTYQGLYTWNIPKDKWMTNMDDALDTHCILCGENYDSGCFRRTAVINGNDWTDELHDIVPDTIKTSFNNFITFVMNSSNEEFKSNLFNYADVKSLIDYYIFHYVNCGMDAFGKNQIFLTYDGTHWIASSYDMDSTFGLYWNGTRFVSTSYRMQEDYESMVNGRLGNLLYIRLKDLFPNEIKTRYLELRSTILSFSNIVTKFENFIDNIGSDLYAEDLTIYTGIPSGSTNNIKQIRNYTRDRLLYVDEQISQYGEIETEEPDIEEIPCTSISLNNSSLEFTDNNTKTLTVTVQPSNTTDTINWNSDNNTIATVNNGVVTPKVNGNCNITVTCGNQTATCSVTVNIQNAIEPDDDTLLYSLPSETTFNGTSDYIDTGIKLLSEDRDYTILIDFTGSEATDKETTILHCMNEVSPYNGINIASPGAGTEKGFYRACLGASTFVLYAKNTDRHKIILKHEKSMNNLLIYTSEGIFKDLYKNIGTIDKNLLLGSYQDANGNKGRYWSGTIHEFKIYNKKFSDDEINNFLEINIDDEEPEEPSTSAELLYELPKIIGVSSLSDTYIDTGISLLDGTHPNFTICMEYEPTKLDNQGLTNGGNANGANLLHMVHETSPWPGMNFYIRNNYYTIHNNGNNFTLYDIPYNDNERRKIVITRKESDNQLNMYINNQVYNIKGTIAVSPINETLLIGGTNKNGVYSNTYNGTIYDCKIYDDILTDEEINAYIDSNFVKEEPTNLLYSLPSETTFNGTSDYIDTGIKLLSEDRDYTIKLDVTNANVLEQQNQASIMHCNTEVAPYPGLNIQLRLQKDYYQITLGNATATAIDVSENRQKIVIRHRKNSNSIVANTSDGQLLTLSRYIGTLDKNVLLGCYQDANGNKGRNWKGTIHEFKIYDGYISDEEISDYIN